VAGIRSSRCSAVAPLSAPVAPVMVIMDLPLVVAVITR
jgi:hypothetical protein